MQIPNMNTKILHHVTVLSRVITEYGANTVHFRAVEFLSCSIYVKHYEKM
jgi:hypothetical protein